VTYTLPDTKVKKIKSNKPLASLKFGKNKFAEEHFK